MRKISYPLLSVTVTEPEAAEQTRFWRHANRTKVDLGRDEVSACSGARGLRERKKAATRRALGLAAMRLAIERGLDNVLIEDIAAAAGVSTRTFNNYFASKYEAICSLAMERGQAIGAPAARPPGRRVADGRHHRRRARAVRARRAACADRDWIEGIRLVIRSPALQGEFLRTQYATQQELAAAIADRIGADPVAEHVSRASWPAP